MKVRLERRGIPRLSLERLISPWLGLRRFAGDMSHFGDPPGRRQEMDTGADRNGHSGGNFGSLAGD